MNTTQEGKTQIVVFTVDGQRYGTPLSHVERIVQAVYVTPLPQAPKDVCGVINVEGRMVPVMSMRRRLGFTERAMELSDQILLIRGPERSLALWVDAVTEVTSCPRDQLISGKDILNNAPLAPAMLKREDGIILVQDFA